MTDPTDIWHVDEEAYLFALRDSADRLAKVYDAAYRVYSRKDKFFKIPTIIFSSINGLASFGTKSFPVEVQPSVPIAVGIISMCIGILSAIDSYLGIGSNRALCKTACNELRSISRAILLETTLPVSDRNQSGLAFVRQMASRAESVYSALPPIKVRHESLPHLPLPPAPASPSSSMIDV